VDFQVTTVDMRRLCGTSIRTASRKASPSRFYCRTHDHARRQWTAEGVQCISTLGHDTENRHVGLAASLSISLTARRLTLAYHLTELKLSVLLRRRMRWSWHASSRETTPISFSIPWFAALRRIPAVVGGIAVSAPQQGIGSG
jgi:hypothetical protein